MRCKVRALTKKFLSKIGIDIPVWLELIYKWKSRYGVENVNNSIYEKRCLMIYIIEPFVTTNISDRHQNLWQAKEMAQIIGTKGYVVDVIDYNNKYVRLKHNYDLIVGLVPRGIDVYSKFMNPGCIRIAYLTSMNLAITSGNEEKRLAELKERRGVQLIPRRFAGYIDKEIEQFDAAWYIGNEYNFHSYDCFKMPPIYYIKNSGYTFNWVNSKQFRDPRQFLFIGSLGQVHKGLDILLELFSQRLKDCTLYVCSGYEQEQDFNSEFYEELYNTPNIKQMGFVDIEGKTYKKIASKCAYTILPSCAEGCAGSILTAMSAGLIAIVSKECGFNDDEVINLPDCSLDTLQNYIETFSKKDKSWIEEQSAKAVNCVQTKYSQKCFSDSVENAINSVLNKHN